MIRRITILCVVVAAIGGLAIVQEAAAQRDAGAKARGEIGTGFWTNRRASRSMQHARDYSRGLYRYSRDARVVRPRVAKSESEELARNIEKAQKQLADVRKLYSTDKQVQAALDVIDKHIAKAAKVHKELHEECCKDAPNRGVTMRCCSEIIKELDKAAAEHAAVLRTLERRARVGAVRTKK